MKVLKFLFFLLLLVGCSTLHERAEKYYESESYDEAVSTYNEILRISPTDQEAIIGLRRSREKWIDQKLVQVRLLRIGGNTLGSLALLKQVYANESSWGVFPKGAVMFTQDEESGFAAQGLKVELETLISKKKLLKVRQMIGAYGMFFQADRSASLKKIESDTLESVQSKCDDLSKTVGPEHYYYGQFVSKFCGQWGVNGPNLEKQKAKLRKELFNDLHFEINIEGLSRAQITQIEKVFLDQWQSSPFYDPEAEKDLTIMLRGEYGYVHREESTTLIHSYTERVPYTETHRETKPKSSEKKDSEINLGSALFGLALNVLTSGILGGSNRTETDNGDGTITVSETKYRDETRTQSYAARLHRQQFKIEVDLKADLSEHKIKANIEKVEELSDHSHNNQTPSIGLYPKAANLLSESDWISRQSTALSQKFSESLQDEWSKLYCSKRLSSTDAQHLREWGFRCLRFSKKAPADEFAQWFENQMGLTLSEGQSVMGSFY